MSERPRLFQLDNLDFVHFDSCGRICIKVKLLLSAWDSYDRVAEADDYVDICLEDAKINEMKSELRSKLKTFIERYAPALSGKEIEKIDCSGYADVVYVSVRFSDSSIHEIGFALSTKADDSLVREVAQLAITIRNRLREEWKRFAREALQEVINDEEVRAKFVEFLRAIARKMEEYGRKHGLVLARREE